MACLPTNLFLPQELVHVNTLPNHLQGPNYTFTLFFHLLSGYGTHFHRRYTCSYQGKPPSFKRALMQHQGWGLGDETINTHATIPMINFYASKLQIGGVAPIKMQHCIVSLTNHLKRESDVLCYYHEVYSITVKIITVHDSQWNIIITLLPYGVFGKSISYYTPIK